MWAMTRTGMCCEYSSAASMMSRPRIASINSSQYVRVYGSSFSIAWGGKGGSKQRRAPLWDGGARGCAAAANKPPRAPGGGGGAGGDRRRDAARCQLHRWAELGDEDAARREV